MARLSVVLKFFKQQGGIFGLFNTFTGGALNQFSVFALGIMPYISSSIIFQLLTSVVPYLGTAQKGRRTLTVRRKSLNTLVTEPSYWR